jgi:hypothetical protein
MNRKKESASKKMHKKRELGKILEIYCYKTISIATSNITNLAVPSVGVAGGIGDNLILCAGAASVYPYSLE